MCCAEDYLSGHLSGATIYGEPGRLAMYRSAATAVDGWPSADFQQPRRWLIGLMEIFSSHRGNSSAPWEPPRRLVGLVGILDSNRGG